MGIIQEYNMDKILQDKIPVLIAAGLSLLLAVYLWFSGFKDEGVFVAFWIPSILVLGAFFYAGRFPG
jgi:hypothetical protein